VSHPTTPSAGGSGSTSTDPELPPTLARLVIAFTDDRFVAQQIHHCGRALALRSGWWPFVVAPPPRNAL
jgi:hypothetical protein